MVASGDFVVVIVVVVGSDLVGMRYGWWGTVSCGGLWGGTVGFGFVLYFFLFSFFNFRRFFFEMLF